MRSSEARSRGKAQAGQSGGGLAGWRVVSVRVNVRVCVCGGGQLRRDDLSGRAEALSLFGLHSGQARTNDESKEEEDENRD